MWGKAKNLLLLLSLALNVPFILMWAAANTSQLRASVSQGSTPRESAAHEPIRGPSNVSSTRSPMPRTFWPRSEGTRSVYREVGVTEEQWHEIEPRLANFRTAMFQLSCEMKRQRNELVELVAASELDYDAIRAKQDEILESHRQTSDLITQNMLQDREILTADQQTKFFKKLRDFCGPSSKSTPIRPPTKDGPAFGSPKRSN
jgi:Spy/CpxP family protein refolding chaperone